MSYLDLVPYGAAAAVVGGAFRYLRVLAQEKTKRLEIAARTERVTIVCTFPPPGEKAAVEEIRKLVIAKAFPNEETAKENAGRGKAA